MDYEITIGLETHVQLRTVSKMFCGCPTGFGADPNTQICPVCLGYPGVLPVMNERAIELTVRTGMMLGCRISTYSKFDRKNYFYPDMPKNYQVSQYDLPLCEGGEVAIDPGDGQARAVRLTRIHLEEDVGKLTHLGATSGIDFNRAGVPLMEIVTEPDLHSPDEALAYLGALKEILQYGDVSDCNLEQGNIRCDANISMRPRGAAELGTKTEIKNMNTFHGVQRALAHEVDRQCRVLESGGRIVQETRRWDADRGVTESMRTKEQAHDYRYFPEPDLLPVVLEEARLAEMRAELPEQPAARRARFAADYGLSGYDAGVLVADRAMADYFERAATGAGARAKAIANTVINDLARELTARGEGIEACPVRPEWVAELAEMVGSGRISKQMAQDLFVEVYAQARAPGELAREAGLEQVSDDDALLEMVDAVLSEHAGVADDFRGGKENALKFLVGQVMRRSRGKANPVRVNELLRDRILGGS